MKNSFLKENSANWIRKKFHLPRPSLNFSKGTINLFFATVSFSRDISMLFLLNYPSIFVCLKKDKWYYKFRRNLFLIIRTSVALNLLHDFKMYKTLFGSSTFFISLANEVPALSFNVEVEQYDHGRVLEEFLFLLILLLLVIPKHVCLRIDTFRHLFCFHCE